MDAEKRASKGGFLQLFDWNGKSRRKLFSNKSESPESSKQGNGNFAYSSALHPQLMEVHENGPGPRGNRDSQYSFASSVNDDEGFGTRAPGVVARLMGLDSLPTSTVSEPCPTSFSNSPFLRDSCSQRSTSNFQIEHHIVNTLPNGGISRNLGEPRLQMVHTRPIERFQSETLPPRSAKSNPITHHRLLSPIKSPGFIPRNNVAYIMEAAAKIIEQGPPSKTKGKLPCLGSSSVPLRILDLKEKMESVQIASRPLESSRRPKVPISLEYNKVVPREKNNTGSGDTPHHSASMGSVKDSSETRNNKGKSVSLAVQAKVNVQSRERLTSSANRSSINRKEGDEVSLGQSNRSQISRQKRVQKRTPMGRTSDVLKQNNQKQNCVSNKDRGAAKVLVSNQQERKSQSTNASVRPNKASNMVPNLATGSRKKNSVAKETGKELLSSKPKTSMENKKPVHRDIHFQESAVKNLSNSKDKRSVKCNVSYDDCFNWDVVDRKNNSDIVSFTFTSPIKRSTSGSQSSGQVEEKNTGVYIDSCDVIGGDALSALLEQKLKELACRVESSDCNFVAAGNVTCSAFSLQDSILNMLRTTSTEDHNNFQVNLQEDKSSHPYGIDHVSVDALLLKAKQKWQVLEEMTECSTSSYNSEYGKELDLQYPSPISNLGPSSSNGSYISPHYETCSITIGSEHLLAEAHGMADYISARKCQPVEVELELSDSASSTSTAFIGGKDTSSMFILTDHEKSSTWELDYITQILCNSDLIMDDFVLGRVNSVITPNLFDQLENPKTGSNESAEEFFKLERKVLFDCVSECLEFRSKQVFGRSYKVCCKWEILFRRKGCLADELHKEISSWTSIDDLMVDELVDKDMSSWHERWVDFGVEEFEEGVDIEKGILTSLVDELVDDLFLI